MIAALIAALLPLATATVETQRTVRRPLPLENVEIVDVEHAFGDLEILPLAEGVEPGAELRLIASGAAARDEEQFLAGVDLVREPGEAGVLRVREQDPQAIFLAAVSELPHEACWALRQVGLLHLLTSPLDLPASWRIMKRHFQRLPQPALSLEDKIWKNLPCKYMMGKGAKTDRLCSVTVQSSR